MRNRKHLQLELAVAVDELRVRKEVEPVVHDLVEGAEQPFTFVSAPLEQLGGFAFALVAEMRAQQVGHLPTVPHLFGHDTLQRQRS